MNSNCEQENGSLQPKVLVLLAAYNGIHWLPEQADSILNQQSVDVELLISVDPSTDGTEAWVDELCAQRDNATRLPALRHGMACRNFYYLIDQATTEGFDYFAFSDQDDLWRPEKCITAINCMQETAADAYSSDVLAFWPDGREKPLKKSHQQTDRDYLMEAPGPGCTFVFNRSLMLLLKRLLRQKRELIERTEYHDWLVYCAARANGLKWTIQPYCGVRYRQHDNNQQGANVGVSAMSKRWKQLIDGHWFQQASLMATIVSEADPQAEDFLQTLARGRLGLWRLALQSSRYRRKLQDRLILSAACVWMIFREPDQIHH